MAKVDTSRLATVIAEADEAPAEDPRITAAFVADGDATWQFWTSGPARRRLGTLRVDAGRVTIEQQPERLKQFTAVLLLTIWTIFWLRRALTGWRQH